MDRCAGAVWESQGSAVCVFADQDEGASGGKTPRTKAAKTAPIADLDPRLLFSFSGIKTAVLRYVELHGLRADAEARAAKVLGLARPPQTKEEALALCPQQVLDLVASFQHAVVGDLMKKTFAAAEALGVRRILVTGGVAANRELRERFAAEAARRGCGWRFQRWPFRPTMRR